MPPKDWKPRFYAFKNFRHLGEPKFLIDGYLTRYGLNMISGPPGSGKTFVALDMALHVLTCRKTWHGRTITTPMKVVYVAAEGFRSVAARTLAWFDYHAPRDKDVNWPMTIIPEPLPLIRKSGIPTITQLEAGLQQGHMKSDEDAWEEHWYETGELDEQGEAIQVMGTENLGSHGRTETLVIIDTLARCLHGGDENSAEDMGLAIDTLDGIRRVLAESFAPHTATVLVIHHTNKNGDAERGSSALRGAVDTLLSLRAKDNQHTLSVVKQKDDAPGPDLQFTLVKAGEKSVVPILSAETPDAVWTLLNPLCQTILVGLFQTANPKGHGYTEFLKLVREHAHKEWSETYIYKMRDLLIERGLIVIRSEGKARLTTLTAEGAALVEEYALKGEKTGPTEGQKPQS